MLLLLAVKIIVLFGDCETGEGFGREKASILVFLREFTKIKQVLRAYFWSERQDWE